MAQGFSRQYDDEITAAAFRVSTRMLGGEDIGEIAKSLYRIGWYTQEVNRILFLAKAMIAKGR